MSERGDGRRALLLASKLALLAAFLVGTNLGVHRRITTIGWRPGLAVFASVWIIACAALLLLAFSPKRGARLFWTVPLVACSFVGFTFQVATATFMSVADLERLLGLIGFADNVTGFYGDILVSAAVWCLAGAIAINMPPYAGSAAMARRVAWAIEFAGVLQLVPVLTIGSILYARGGEGTDGLPVQYNGLAFLTVLGAERVLFEGAPPARHDVALRHDGVPPIRNIVLVMDESVRGDLLDINARDGIDTGTRSAGNALFNFGLASSIANCSATTNVALRYGATKTNYLRDIRTNPSMWRYAKKAGFRTVYIDGQRHNGHVHNLMTAEEMADIDQFIQLDTELKPFQKDLRIARILVDLLKTGDAARFVLINKMGSHFPYEGKYPPDQAVYRPTMSSNYSGNEADPQNLARPSDENADMRRRFKNSYLNSVRWNTREFFRTVLPEVDAAHTVLIYTADHGQDLHDDGRPGYGTHCTDGPAVPAEGTVPLFVITGIPAVATQMQPAAARNVGRVSQFNVFPTVLALMGYDREALAASRDFEPTLFSELPDDNQRFLSTFFVRWGKKPVWNRIAPHREG